MGSGRGLETVLLFLGQLILLAGLQDLSEALLGLLLNVRSSSQVIGRCPVPSGGGWIRCQHLGALLFSFGVPVLNAGVEGGTGPALVNDHHMLISLVVLGRIVHDRVLVV